jgi:hypothetical protein
LADICVAVPDLWATTYNYYLAVRGTTSKEYQQRASASVGHSCLNAWLVGQLESFTPYRTIQKLDVESDPGSGL